MVCGDAQLQIICRYLPYGYERIRGTSPIFTAHIMIIVIIYTLFIGCAFCRAFISHKAVAEAVAFAIFGVAVCMCLAVFSLCSRRFLFVGQMVVVVIVIGAFALSAILIGIFALDIFAQINTFTILAFFICAFTFNFTTCVITRAIWTACSALFWTCAFTRLCVTF